MGTTRTRTPWLEGGQRSTQFFNGRLLTAEDMTQEQDAARAGLARLGQALGDGVAWGLEVTEATGRSSPAAPVLQVEAGLAIDRRGRVIELPARVDVALSGSDAVTATGDGATAFALCDGEGPGPYTAGQAAYLFTISAVEGREGRAPVSGLGNDSAACNARYRIEGALFRLRRIELGAATLAQTSLLRNLLAHACFGQTELHAFAADPFGPARGGYGLLDGMRPACLGDDETPLAVLHWAAGQGIRFVDRWAVRRRPTPLAAVEREFPAPGQGRLAVAALSERWRLLAGARRRAEAEARFYQFQDHIADLRAAQANVTTLAANSFFTHLPAFGIVPVRTGSASNGFDVAAFFGAHASADIATLDAARLRALEEMALDHDPVDLRSAGKVQLYRIYENLIAFQMGLSQQLAVVFAAPSLPYLGTARFGIAQYAESRYADTVI